MTQIAFSRPFLGREEEEAAAAVIRSGWIVGGKNLAEFEARFAHLCGAAHGIGVSSWTTGGFLVMKALDIGPGDEVIVPSLTFIASVNIIVHAGATPVFVDVDPQTFNIDPEDVARKVTPRTKAILPVDQLGMPCEIDRISEIAEAHGLIVVQDAACAVGSFFRGRPVGADSPITIFSLHARKVVTTGEGGMIVTNDGELASRLRRLRHQGMSLSDFERHNASPTTFETYPEIGYNFRLTDIQAAIGLVQLDRLDAMLATRREIAEFYCAHLRNHPFIETPFQPKHVMANWQSFQLTVRPIGGWTRNRVMEKLHEAGVSVRRGVMASHLEAPYLGFTARLPNTEAAAAQCMQLPMHAAMNQAEAQYVIDHLWQLAN